MYLQTPDPDMMCLPALHCSTPRLLEAGITVLVFGGAADLNRELTKLEEQISTHLLLRVLNRDLRNRCCLLSKRPL